MDIEYRHFDSKSELCDYIGEQATHILERISSKRIVTPKAKAPASAKPNMLIDIQAKLQQAYSPGFGRWAKMFNLKEMAKTLTYFHRIDQYRLSSKLCPGPDRTRS